MFLTLPSEEASPTLIRTKEGVAQRKPSFKPSLEALRRNAGAFGRLGKSHFLTLKDHDAILSRMSRMLEAICPSNVAGYVPFI